MKKTLKPETTKPQYVVTTDITYAQVDSWFGHCRRDLKLDLIYPEEVPLFDKYDEYVPPELVRKGFACGVLRMDEVKARAAEWGRNGGRTPVSPERVISLPQKEPRH